MRVLFMLLIMLLSLAAAAQESPMDTYFQSLDASPVEEEAIFETELAENWSGMQVDINRAGLDDLLTIPGLSESQARAIIYHREVFGPFLSLEELQVIEEIDLAAIKPLLPFLMVRKTHLLYDPRPFKQRLKSVEKRFLMRTSWRQERAIGYTEEDGYLGNGPSVYARLLLRQPQDFSIGLAIEQDAGEPYGMNATPAHPGVDQVSAHFMIENRDNIQKLVLGDFRYNSGAGLVFGGGFPGGKWPADQGRIRPAAETLMPHTSGREGLYFRGAGISIGNKTWQMTSFASARSFDAMVIRDSTGVYVSSFTVPGYHRTSNEIDRRGTLPIYTGGMSVQYNPVDYPFRIGVTLAGTILGHELRPKEKVYDPTPFTGDRWAHSSIWYMGHHKKLYYFGEVAKGYPAGFAALSGALFSFSKTEDLAVVARHYTNDFQSFYGRSFGESSTLSNESGIYTAFRFSPARRISVLIGADHFVFPDIRYRSYTPSRGHEYALLISRESRHLQYSLSFRDKTKPRNNADTESIEYIPVDFRKQQVALRLSYAPRNSLITWQSRIYWNRTLPENSYGFGVSQDLSANRGKWSLSGRVALFDTDTFDNRLYLYEKDVWGAFSIPMYYGRGMRTFFMIRYKATRQLSLWARMGRFRYRDREMISSGLNSIEDDKTTDIRLQLTYRWW
ncbi:helix-hairpin-helix domain-containing protein [Roseivirga sp. BDSF3-8]|uniref:helix-hairpin-helix domain-containing protein n=1 Tax=Roseivirga sp. BDSF3-8 TaxID=3241598 RepID=UPI0035318BD0